MRVLILAVVTASALAASARAEVLDPLVPAFQKACRPSTDPAVARGGAGRDVGAIDIKVVRNELVKLYAIDPGLLLDKTPADLTQRALSLSAASFEDVDAKLLKATDTKLSEMRTLVGEWANPSSTDAPLLALRHGGLVIVDKTGAPADPAAALGDVLAGKTTNLVLICPGPKPAPEPMAPEPPASTFVMAKNADDLSETDLGKKSFAEFSYADDREHRAQAYGIHVAIGRQWAEKQLLDANKTNWTLSRGFTLYSAYERSGSNDPTADNYINNLNFGGRVSGEFGLPGGAMPVGYYGLSIQAETDDDFKARAYSAELRIDPPISALGNRTFVGLTPLSNGIDLEGFWSIEGVSDWIQVDDPGEKKQLRDQAEYARLGYDVGFKVRLGPVEKDWRLIWSTLYQLRDGQTEDGGDAQLFTSSLVFALSKKTHYSAGLSYERGENLQSFAKSELWKLVLGLRY